MCDEGRQVVVTLGKGSSLDGLVAHLKVNNFNVTAWTTDTVPHELVEIDKRITDWEVTCEALKRRVSYSILSECFDRDGSGKADEKLVEALCEEVNDHLACLLCSAGFKVKDASSRLLRNVRRLGLDLAQGWLALRFPDYVRCDGHALLEGVTSGLRIVAACK